MGNEHSSPHSARTTSPSSISSSTPGVGAAAGAALEHPKIYKHRSLSPEKLSTPQRQARMSRYRASFRNGLPPPCSSNSSQPSTLVTINSGVESARLPRRTKSFRPGAGAQRAPTSFRLPTCQITGLTIHQKSLITLKWKEMDRATEIEYCRNVFETLFKREPRFLRVIDLQDCDEWKIHANLRIHIRRFCDMLSDVIKHLNDPQSSLNSIREFGSSYASEPSSEGFSSSPRPHVPSAFWETFIFALNNAAKDMQVETSSRSSESPTSIDRRFLIPTPFEDSQITNTTSSTLTLHSSSAPHMRRLLTNNYFSNGGGLSSGNGSVCPRAAEAWNLLAIFIVGQMRFAYELERLLQVEIKRLGLTSYSSNSATSSPTSTSPPPPSLQQQQSQQHNVQFSIA